MELKELCKVSINGRESVLDQKDIEWYVQNKYTIENVEPIGKLYPEGVEVKVLSEGSGRCYTYATYGISSPKRLTEFDMQVLRAQYNFMGGQRHAHVNLNEFKEENGKFIYQAFSECDSSD